jgi:hypothetical protein
MSSKFTKSQIIAASGALLIAAAAMPAKSATITDTYIGSDNHGWGDVIGATSKFDTQSMEVSVAGTVLSVAITSNFAGRGDDGEFASYTVGGTGIGYGDLFLSSSWNPAGTGPNYLADQANNGTVWSYGFSLDNRWMNESEAGTGTLYSLNAGDNVANTLLADDFMTGATYRNGQEVAVDTSSDVTAISNGIWNIDTGTSTINFSIDLAGTSLLASPDLALHWGPSCANDVIEGLAPSVVPVPPAVWLFGSGLLGLVGVARRKIK